MRAHAACSRCIIDSPAGLLWISKARWSPTLGHVNNFQEATGMVQSAKLQTRFISSPVIWCSPSSAHSPPWSSASTLFDIRSITQSTTVEHRQDPPLFSAPPAYCGKPVQGSLKPAPAQFLHDTHNFHTHTSFTANQRGVGLQVDFVIAHRRFWVPEHDGLHLRKRRKKCYCHTLPPHTFTDMAQHRHH